MKLKVKKLENISQKNFSVKPRGFPDLVFKTEVKIKLSGRSIILNHSKRNNEKLHVENFYIQAFNFP